MSIFASFFAIEDEREWVAELETAGIQAGVIRDGEPEPEDLDAPYIYQGSNILPDTGDPRGGSVDLASIPAHIRFWRENPDAPVESEPDLPVEPFLRFSVHENPETPNQSEGDATVLLNIDQARRLIDALNEWIERTAP